MSNKKDGINTTGKNREKLMDKDSCLKIANVLMFNNHYY